MLPRLRTLIYARVSTEDQAEKYGLPSQLRACREYAAAHGLEIIEEICDEGISGAILDRPGLARVRQLARESAADVVLMLDVDRLSRELAHLVILKTELDKRVRLEFVNATFENSPSGRMFFGIRSVIAQYEREVIRDRTTRGQRERAQTGLPAGGVIAYGYRRGSDGQLVIDEPRAATVRQIYAWYDAGLSMRAIVRKLREVGAPTAKGGAWVHCSVRHVLTNETYTGAAHYGKRHRAPCSDEEIERRKQKGRAGKHDTVWVFRPAAEWIALPAPPLVEREQWDRVRARIAANPWRGRPSARYLLRGLLYCSCGRRMGGEAGRTRAAYRCTGRDSLRAATERCLCSVNAARVDDAAWRKIVDVYTDPDFLRAILRERAAQLRDVGDPGRVLELQGQIRKLKAREENALSLMLDPDLAADRAAIKRQYRAAQEERTRRQGELAALDARSQPIALGAGEWIEETTRLLRGYIAGLTAPEQRQQFVRGVMARCDWDGQELKMRCFIGPKSDSTSRRDSQFQAIEVLLTARLAA